MKSTAFIEIVSSAYGVDEKTVTLFARLLKEAGLLTSGGRGRHAPHMQPTDAARITIALLATDKPARAVDRLERFRNLTFRPSESKGSFPSVLGIEEGATLERVLTNLFAANQEADDPFGDSPYVEVHENARRAMIEFSSEKGKCGAVFGDTNRTEEQKAQDRGEFYGIRKSRGLASIELMKLHTPFYCEQRDGKSWEELLDEVAGRASTGSSKLIPDEVKVLLNPFVIRADENNG